MNDSRYTLRLRDFEPFSIPQMVFEPVHIDQLYEDFLCFCKTEREKIISKDSFKSMIEGGWFNKVTLDPSKTTVFGVKPLRDSSERGAFLNGPPPLKLKIRRFLDQNTEVSGMSYDSINRAELYNSFLKNSKIEVSRQVFYRAILDLSFGTVRYPISAGFAKGGVHCFRGVRWKDDPEEL
jgi:hypothetical protein